MKNRFYTSLMLCALWLAGSATAAQAQGQAFSIPWFVIAGGGGSASGGGFSTTGTFGQWDAAAVLLTNDNTLSLNSGYWSYLQNVSVPVPSAPLVIIDDQIIVAITSPANNFSTTNSSVLVKGTVKGLASGSQLFLTVNTNAPALVAPGALAKGSQPFTFEAGLTPGINLITAQTIDTNSTPTIVSPPATVTVLYATGKASSKDTSTLTLTVFPAGRGAITGEKNGAVLEINKVYPIKAAPAGNWLFSNWTLGTNTNSVISSNASLSFIMMTNLALQANFVTNPFTAVAGVYNGLFSPANGISEETSGFLTATLAATTKGVYSAKVLLDGGSFSFSGSFDFNGDSQFTILRAGGLPPVDAILHLNLDSPDGQLTGYVVNFASNGWTSVLQANLNPFSKTHPASDYTGKYNLVLPPGPGSPADSPGGYSYITLNNTSLGAVTVGGTLADKTTLISQSVAVDQNGDIPLYVSLYSKNGSIQGWINLTNLSANAQTPVQTVIATNLAWIKPSQSKTLYPAGFTSTNLAAFGSLYVPPAAKASALTLNNATLVISNGDIAGGLVFSNLVLKNETLSCTTNNALSGKITATTGAMTVTFPIGSGSTKITASGVVLQDTAGTNAAGFFVSPGVITAAQSGYFLLLQP